MVLFVVAVFMYVQSIQLVEAITTTGDHCMVQGLYVPQGETWQPAGKCAETTCEGKNVTSTKGCSTPVLTEGWILIPEDPSKAYPGCCPTYVSPATTKPPLETETPTPPLQGTNSSGVGVSAETEVDSLEAFDCCFHCCYHCCFQLMIHRREQDFDSSEESDESEEY